ncbi:hypothetical protein ACFY15_35770 [Streptomyces sp. NPDC001373]|uniref:hypothetical protein n=1 Tax=Streptomyces sp. NPDC001373 TaxID=3364565 RepID=UPI003687F0F4
MSRLLAVLRFEEDGPAVTGEWAALSTAERTHRNWIGLYGSHPMAVIQLIEINDAGERERVLKLWTRAEAEGRG